MSGAPSGRGVNAPVPPLLVKIVAVVALVVSLALTVSIVLGDTTEAPLGERLESGAFVFVVLWVVAFLVVTVLFVVLGHLTGREVGSTVVEAPPAGDGTAAPSAALSARRKLVEQLDQADLAVLGQCIDVLGLCQKPWFDPGSEADQKLLLSPKPLVPLEVDTFEGLLRVLQPDLSPTNAAVVYQNWGDSVVAPDGSSARPFKWLSKERASEVGRALKGGPVRTFVFIVTMFGPGALRAFADALGPGQLSMLGLFWYLSGDDVTDEEENAADIGYAATTLGVERLSVLTGAFDGGCDERLAAALAGASRLRRCRVFRKDEGNTWPAMAAPKVAAVVEGR